MERMWQATIKGFNDQVKSLCEGAKEESVETIVSFFVFDRLVHPVYLGKSVNYLTEISETDYLPKGDTSMYDAIGQMVHALTEISEEADPANSYLVNILSDGKDTHSKKYTQATCGELIKHKQDTKKWTFNFMGANQNLLNVNKNLHIPLGNIANYAATGSGMAYAASKSAGQMKKFLKAKASGLESTASFHGSEELCDYAEQEKNDKLPETTEGLKTWFNGSYGAGGVKLPIDAPKPKKKKK